MNNRESVTFVLTSCGRPDLLDRTLKSFFKFNKFKINKYYVVEDSLDKKFHSSLKKKWGNRQVVSPFIYSQNVPRICLRSSEKQQRYYACSYFHDDRNHSNKSHESVS